MTAFHLPSENDLSAAAQQTIHRRAAEVGRELFAQLREDRTPLLNRRWLDERIMKWAMRDEQLKVQLFRFVDVLPMLHSSDAVCEHLFEYLGEVRDRLPKSVSVPLGLSMRNALTRAALARAARLSATDLARRFIAGTNPQEVVEAARRERKVHRAFTLDILGEAVISDKEADQFHAAYIDLIQQVAPVVNAWREEPQVDRGVLGPLPRMNLSIKLSALDAQFDPIAPQSVLQHVGERFRQLLRVAREHQAFINVDMESYEKKDLTLWLFKEILMEDEFRDVGDVGIVIQCYLREAARDLQELLSWSQNRGKAVWVRLVKGAYWDYETIHAGALGWPIPVFTEKWQSDAMFEWATRFVMQHHENLRPALGSHNLRSLAHGIAVAEHLGLPDNGFEIQMLYGMADTEKEILVERGRRIRVYMPYGELIPGMAYLVRRLLENTSNDSFLRAGLSDDVSPDSLLRNPMEHASSSVNSVPDRKKENAMAQPTTSSLDATFRNEPPVDFSLEPYRQKMRDGLQKIMMELGRDFPLRIAGESVVSSEWLESYDPSFKDRLVGRFAVAHGTHVDDAVAAAKAAWPGWRDTPAQERIDILRQVAEQMRQRLFELAAWEVFECGKGWRESTNDLIEAIDFCEYYALCAEALNQPAGADVPGEENRFYYSPRGVAAVIAPWNFPLAILTGMTAAALVTGNTVVVKPAEQATVAALQLIELFEQAGVPPHVCQIVPGRGEVAGARLVDHPDVALIAFTGSRNVGLQINARAAAVSTQGMPMVKHVIAEMGGKNAIIVDADADLDEAVLGVTQSSFGYQGQKCSACSRVIVLDAVYDAFVKRLVEAARSLQVGPAEVASTDVGPVIDHESFERIHEFIRRGRQEGQEELAAEVAPELVEQGYFIGPHIFADVAADATIAQQEIFGPILVVIRAANLDEAIEIANGTEYALTGGVYSRSPQNLDRVAARMQVGNLYLNRSITGAVVGRHPFGGFKMSGIGTKAGGPDYLLQFVIPRTITENTMRRGFAPE